MATQRNVLRKVLDDILEQAEGLERQAQFAKEAISELNLDAKESLDRDFPAVPDCKECGGNDWQVINEEWICISSDDCGEEGNGEKCETCGDKMKATAFPGIYGCDEYLCWNCDMSFMQVFSDFDKENMAEETAMALEDLTF